jgi:hypothetical protein
MDANPTWPNGYLNIRVPKPCVEFVFYSVKTIHLGFTAYKVLKTWYEDFYKRKIQVAVTIWTSDFIVKSLLLQPVVYLVTSHNVTNTIYTIFCQLVECMHEHFYQNFMEKKLTTKFFLKKQISGLIWIEQTF